VANQPEILIHSFIVYYA